MKKRADELLVERGLAPNRSKARALIMAGQVRIGDQVIDKAGQPVGIDAAIEVEEGQRYVSRGGDKLEHALMVFEVSPAGLICADFGASTGGFTDVLLKAGAARVYAVDVGYGQLDYQLRTDDRVIVMERTNVRYLEGLPELVDLVTVDVSFISLELIYPVVARVLKPGSGHCIALVKPQFEAGREQVRRGGVVRDPRVHRDVLLATVKHARAAGLHPRHVAASPVLGPKGNREFLMLLDTAPAESGTIESQIINVVRMTEGGEG